MQPSKYCNVCGASGRKSYVQFIHWVNASKTKQFCSLDLSLFSWKYSVRITSLLYFAVHFVPCYRFVSNLHIFFTKLKTIKLLSEIMVSSVLFSPQLHKTSIKNVAPLRLIQRLFSVFAESSICCCCCMIVWFHFTHCGVAISLSVFDFSVECIGLNAREMTPCLCNRMYFEGVNWMRTNINIDGFVCVSENFNKLNETTIVLMETNGVCFLFLFRFCMLQLIFANFYELCR